MAVVAGRDRGNRALHPAAAADARLQPEPDTNVQFWLRLRAPADDRLGRRVAVDTAGGAVAARHYLRRLSFRGRGDDASDFPRA